MSKTFTWTAVMLLVERGLIDLDADLNDYLDQFQIAPAFREPVTMRQIMHHRGGFEDTLRLFAVADDEPRRRPSPATSRSCSTTTGSRARTSRRNARP